MKPLLLVLLVAASAGCARVKPAVTAAEKKIASALINDQQESELGLQLHQQLVKENVRISKNPVLIEYVQGLAAKLAPAADKERKVSWHVWVIEDDQTVNAFAVPGGGIYVFTGLLLAAQNEAKVAGVMG